MNTSFLRFVTVTVMGVGLIALAEESLVLRHRMKRVVSVNEYYVDILRRHEIPLTRFDKIAINTIVGTDMY